MRHRVALRWDTNVSEELATSMFRVKILLVTVTFFFNVTIIIFHVFCSAHTFKEA
jgi:hypothetical protein